MEPRKFQEHIVGGGVQKESQPAQRTLSGGRLGDSMWCVLGHYRQSLTLSDGHSIRFH